MIGYVLLALYGPSAVAYGLWLGLRISFARDRQSVKPPSVVPAAPEFRIPDAVKAVATEEELAEAKEALGRTELEGEPKDPGRRWKA